MMKDLTVSDLADIQKGKGFPFFDGNKAFNVNLIGVRSNNDEVNQFDDVIYLVYRDSTLAWELHCFKATTHPGKYWLNHPMSPLGTAILAEGHHPGIWKMGLHQGKYTALVQNKPCRVYRDNDQDNILDMEPETIQSGVFGINMHRSNPYTQSYLVEKWSAGCQVFAISSDFEKAMWICQRSLNYFPENSFSYTLHKESGL
jgi:hypothetical protein